MSIKKLKGECNHCSICCTSHAYIIQQSELHKWLKLHGHNRPENVEYLVTVMVKKISGDRLKIIFMDACERFVASTRRCKDYKNRPQKCKDFPSMQEQCVDIAQCSFNEQNKTK